MRLIKKQIKKEAFIGDFFNKNKKNKDELDTQLIQLLNLGSLEEIQSLINEGANVKNVNLLTSAILYLREDVLDLLLANGAKEVVNNQNDDGETPVNVTIKRSSPNMEDLLYILFKYGAYPEAQDINGNNALHVAVASDNMDYADLLFQYSKNPFVLLTTQNQNGNVPFDLVNDDSDETNSTIINLIQKYVSPFYEQIVEKKNQKDWEERKKENEKNIKKHKRKKIWQEIKDLFNVRDLID